MGLKLLKKERTTGFLNKKKKNNLLYIKNQTRVRKLKNNYNLKITETV